jgi:hypothetical protein
MTELERLTLTTAFLAAVVAAGLALSWVPHVEVVTLTVFAAGVVLGSARGAVVGAVGMPLYVFALSALRGYPPSPIPILAVQAAAFTLPGLAGGLWRRLWLVHPTRRRTGYLLLPVTGFLLAFLTQAALNLAYAWFLSPGTTSRLAVFLSGMGFGLIDMGVNAVVFAAAGPPTAAVLRRIARSRGWWGRSAAVAAVALLALAWGASVRPAEASAVADTTAAGTPVLFAPSAADTVQIDTLAAPVDTLRAVKGDVTLPDTVGVPGPEAVAESLGTAPPVPAERGVPLRPLHLFPAPVWQPFSAITVSPSGEPTLQDADLWDGGSRSWTTAPAVPRTLDRWGLGWGRVRYSYDGLPLAGPVHDDGEPVDLPLAWRGTWRERWSAAGTDIDLSSPRPLAGDPVSQVSLTSGSLGRRTTEFGLFRNLGPVNFGGDLRDRQEQGFTILNQGDQTRLWLRLESVPGRRPDWTVDLATGKEKERYLSSGTLLRSSRRLQGSLSGPFLGGRTRLALQLRRQTLALYSGPGAFGEVIFDGFTFQADWAPPGLAGLDARLRFDRDRRRNVLAADRTLDGGSAGLSWGRTGDIWNLGAEASVGDQEPYGFTWSGTAAAELHHEHYGGRFSVSHEEDLPPLVIGVDRPTPEAGIGSFLQLYESASDPESRTAVRAEAGVKGERAGLNLGAWAGRIRHYLLESNPLWAPFGPYTPEAIPSGSADVLGAYASLRLSAGRGIYGEGTARIQNRDERDVPYLPVFNGDGAVHWRRYWFKRSLDLDAALGGLLVGPRTSPTGERYPTTPLGYAKLVGRVDNGLLLLMFQNLGGAYMESDFRSSDTVTPLPIAGQTFVIGLTMFLSQ